MDAARIRIVIVEEQESVAAITSKVYDIVLDFLSVCLVVKLTTDKSEDIRLEGGTVISKEEAWTTFYRQ